MADVLRHVLVHGYFEVDLDLVWLVVENEPDKLKLTISSAMAELAMQGDADEWWKQSDG